MKQPIFLSLGSNYSLEFVLLAVKQLFRQDAKSIFAAGREIEKKLGGKPVFYYKGRDAIEQALVAIQRKHTQPLTVFTQAASCYALEEAIVRAGARPVYVDVGTLRLNMTVTTVDAAFTAAGRPRHAVLIVQHLLGFPAAVENIRAWCQEHSVILIEDVAQSYGAMTKSGALVGTIGDVVIGSLGRDKVLDCVSGGFALVRMPECAPEPKQLQPIATTGQLLKDLVYPATTWSIRAFHSIGLGKILFWVFKKMGLLSSPILSPLPMSSGLPAEFGQLLGWQLQKLDRQLEHRRRIAQMYYSQLGPWLIALHITEQDLNRAACLRVPFLVPDVTDCIAYCKKQNIYLSDRWYRSPVDMGSFDFPTVYDVGQCSNAEFLTNHLCNLPTHQAIAVAQAEELARVLRTYLSQPKVVAWYVKTLEMEVKL